MCTVEMMVAGGMYQMQQQEEIKGIKREQARSAYARGIGAEAIRRIAEETKVKAWWDAQMRGIAKKRGSAKVEQAGAGLSITAGEETDLHDADWAAASSELEGQRAVILDQQAAFGEIRAVELRENMEDRLDQYEKADSMDWVMQFGMSFMQGMAMEQSAGTLEDTDKLFGISVEDWKKLGGSINPFS